MEAEFRPLDSSTIPSELVGPLPRKTIATGEATPGIIYAVIILAIGLSIVLLILKDTVQQMQQSEALHHEGIEVAGKTLKLSSFKKPKVKYSFMANGTVYTGEARVPDELMNTLVETGEITIRYLPSDPLVNHPTAWEWSVRLYWGYLVFPIVFFLPGLALLLSLRFERLIVAQGMAAVATITQCSAGRSRFSIKYEFWASDGRVTTGSGWSDDRQEVGAPICILYLPQNPRRNQPYPSPNYRVDG